MKFMHFYKSLEFLLDDKNVSHSSNFTSLHLMRPELHWLKLITDINEATSELILSLRLPEVWVNSLWIKRSRRQHHTRVHTYSLFTYQCQYSANFTLHERRYRNIFFPSYSLSRNYIIAEAKLSFKYLPGLFSGSNKFLTFAIR